MDKFVSIYLFVRWPVVAFLFVMLNIMPFTQLFLWGTYVCVLPVLALVLMCALSEYKEPHHLKKAFNIGMASLPIMAFLFAALIAGDYFQSYYVGWFTSLVENRRPETLEITGWAYLVGVACILLAQGTILHQYMKIRK